MYHKIENRNSTSKIIAVAYMKYSHDRLNSFLVPKNPNNYNIYIKINTTYSLNC